MNTVQAASYLGVPKDVIEGLVAKGGVPYDFRFPTLKRFRDAYWNPGDGRIFTDRVVGIGWAINFAQLLPRLQEGYRRLAERAQPDGGDGPVTSASPE